jgi:succinoglycan biosynthesis protein ExoO
MTGPVTGNASRPAAGEPLVSLLMVARNAAAHIDAALLSARRQSLRRIEIIVVDDGSTDATGAIIQAHAAADARVIPVRGHGKGLAAVRNLSITAAAAPWGAVLDADDILHPRHVERLIDLARRTGADMAAGNMIEFGAATQPALFASGEGWRRERMIDHAAFLASGRIDGQGLQLGYLKPLLRLDALRRRGIAYDTRLRIGEDWDLVERALAAGLTYAFRPEPTYYYRRHAGSTSFRWTCADLAALIEAERGRIAQDAAAPGADGPLTQARADRLASLEDALAHCEAVEHLKARRLWRALPALLRRRRAFGLLAASMREGAARRLADFRRRAAPPALSPVLGGETEPDVLVCGEAEPGSPVAVAAALAEASGHRVRHLTSDALIDPVAIARAGRGAALVLIAAERHADAAAHAIGDGALFVAAADVRHPLIDFHIEPHSCGDLLALLGTRAVVDTGLARSLRAGAASNPADGVPA